MSSTVEIGITANLSAMAECLAGHLVHLQMGYDVAETVPAPKVLAHALVRETNAKGYN